MNKHFGLILLTLAVGCNEDVTSNRRLGDNRTPTETTRPELGTEGSENVRSHVHREKGSAILSYAEEIRKTLANDIPPKLYRFIPLMEKDDEGSSKNVTTIDDVGRPSTTCGSGAEFAGIDARITDCFQKNAERALWDGLRYGASGEGVWKLVLKNGPKELWLDGRTGMVWTHLMKSSTGVDNFNWCKASGNTENDTNEIKTDCNEIGEGESVCSGITMEEVKDQIKWRLPTRNDYLQADLNGLRFVLRKESERGLWTATIRAASEGRSEAWVYNSKEGTLTSGTLSTERQVRCIGAPVR